MSFVTSIVTGIAGALGTVAGWLWKGISGLTNSAWTLLTKYVIPTLRTVVTQISDLYNRIDLALKTVKGWIDEAVGGFFGAIDALEAELRNLIGAQVDKILKELGFREGLLKQWVKEWALSQLKPVWDEINTVRGLVFELNKKTVYGYQKAVNALREWTSTELNILGHKVNINIENIDKVLEDLGLVEPEKETPETQLILNKLDKQRDLSWKAQLVAYEETGEELPLPSEDINEVIEKVKGDWKDEPCMEGMFIRWQVELIKKDLGMDNEAEEAEEAIRSVIEAKEEV